ncbi:MAG: hypothetical protein CAPSK01_000688 [Candidatus Accumulibacter vicinus]|uniref:Uncharacterized protein n=1 Tax=Candidatus Accumulibacter vicinus TaxID=2954382 RepID=A0A084Y4I5_9PROT|nr:MAG: hypothetical protein CAPSK01_000688 [Candidatus Accumulibacter vicinus]
MHHVRAGADRDQTGERTVMDEAGVVPARNHGHQRAADHCHQRVHCHQAGDLVDRLRAHDVEAEPADGQNPGAKRQERDRRWRVRGNSPLLGVASVACAEQKHCRQGDPAAHRMHHNGPREVVKFLPIAGFQPGLEAEGLVPGNAFEEGIDETDDQKGRGQLRVEPGTLGDAARNDRRDRCREGQQEEESGQLEAILLQQRFGAGEEVDPVGDAEADEEIGNRRYREIGQDLDQRVHLALLAYRSQFEKGKARVHRQHHDATEQDEENVTTRLEYFHGSSGISGRSHQAISVPGSGHLWIQ